MKYLIIVDHNLFIRKLLTPIESVNFILSLSRIIVLLIQVLPPPSPDSLTLSTLITTVTIQPFYSQDIQILMATPKRIPLPTP